ncbi:MAG TPA: AmmeMemoRadiSam system protein A [Steroidobacteraceae bacterium]|nr:AmmeMemoRadiSam system protein A [Steroidobacteraceae bacterium]
MLENTDRIRLLDLARCSVERGLGRHMPDRHPEGAWSASLLEQRATFTTLELVGELRGCCGTIEPRRPLAHDVWHNAWVSAFADPRFPPVSPAELPGLKFTISVLTPLEPIAARSEPELIAALEPGVDGLVLTCGPARATFLPTVWELLPEPREFLAQLRHKAGLSAFRSWHEITALRYRTETFSSHVGAALAA